MKICAAHMFMRDVCCYFLRCFKCIFKSGCKFTMFFLFTLEKHGTMITNSDLHSTRVLLDQTSRYHQFTIVPPGTHISYERQVQFFYFLERGYINLNYI